MTVVILSGSGRAGAPFLNLWPTARSAALSGAVTASIYGVDVLQSNPGMTAFQDDSRVGGAYFGVLPDSGHYDQWMDTRDHDQRLAAAGFSLTFENLLGEGRDLGLGVHSTTFRAGEVDVVNDRGDFLGRYRPNEMSVSIQSGLRLSSRLGVGLAIRYIRSTIVQDWVWPVCPELGVSSGGDAASWAIDAGGVYRPTKQLCLGLSLANLGTQLAYGESAKAPLPTMARFGLAYTPIDAWHLRPTALVELDKLVAGEGTSPFRAGDVQKSVAAEVAIFRILTLRGSYLSDPAGNREGISYGGGVGYEDYVAFDVANDAALYGFTATDWRFTLTLDVLRIIRRLAHKA